MAGRRPFVTGAVRQIAPEGGRPLKVPSTSHPERFTCRSGSHPFQHLAFSIEHSHITIARHWTPDLNAAILPPKFRVKKGDWCMAKPRRRRKIGSKKRKARRDRRKR